MNRDYYLVINLGLRSIRAIVFDISGKKIAQEWMPIRTILQKEHVEQNPQEWWSLALKVIHKTLKEEHIKEKLRYITVTSSACCLVSMKKGEPLGNAIMVSDKRSQQEANILKQDQTLNFLWKNPNFIPTPSFMIPKILWLQQHKPDLYQEADKFIASNDFLIYKLCNKYITDPLNAEKFYYDQDKEEYSPEILKKLNIDANKFPTVKEVGAIIGQLNPELAKELGVSKEIDIILTTYDALCAFWGAGISKPGQVCNVCGTCGSFRVFSEKKVENMQGIFAQEFKNLNAIVVGGSNNLEGGLLEWAKKSFYDQFQTNDEYLYETMQEEASRSEVGADGLIFLPYLIGERTPFFDPHIRGSFFGIERNHTRKEFIRSIFESTGFLSMNIIKEIEASGININEIRVSGGLVKNELICQIKADISGKKVLLIDEIETTALGALILMLKSIHNLSIEELSDKVKIKKEFTPNLINHQKYKHLYNLFQEYYQNNQQLFKYRKEVLDNIEGLHKEHIIDNL